MDLQKDFMDKFNKLKIAFGKKEYGRCKDLMLHLEKELSKIFKTFHCPPLDPQFDPLEGLEDQEESNLHHQAPVFNLDHVPIPMEGIECDLGAKSVILEEFGDTVQPVVSTATELTSKEPTSTEPTTKEPTATELTSKEPTSTEPTSREPTATELTSKEPTSTEETATETNATEPTATEETAKEPNATEPTATELTSKEPTTKEPTATEETAKEPTATKLIDEFGISEHLFQVRLHARDAFELVQKSVDHNSNTVSQSHLRACEMEMQVAMKALLRVSSSLSKAVAAQASENKENQDP